MYQDSFVRLDQTERKPAAKQRHDVALGVSPCLFPQLLGPKARKHVIIPQRSCLTTQPVVAQRTTGRLPESTNQNPERVSQQRRLSNTFGVHG